MHHYIVWFALFLANRSNSKGSISLEMENSVLLNTDKYNELQKIFDESYRALVPVYRQLAEFSR